MRQNLAGGYELATAGGVTYGPVVGLDYARIKVDGYSEMGARGAMSYDEMDFETLELSLGGRIGKAVTLGTVPLRLTAQASLVRELADGRPKGVSLSAVTGDVASDITFTEADKSFGRVALSAEFDISPATIGWLKLNSRVGHSEGAQATASVGLGLTF